VPRAAARGRRAAEIDDEVDGDDDATENGGVSLREAVLVPVIGFLARHPRDSVVAIVAAAVIAAIVINGLLLQPGPHPAPIFALRRSQITAGEATGGVTPVLPRPRPAEAGTVRTRVDVIADVQRELTRRGFYDGPADGVYGAKTDTAVRDFEQAAGLKPSIEPNEALLQSIIHAPVKTQPHAAQKDDQIAGLLVPQRQVTAIQRALSEYGYGPLKATGSYDADTRAAIERFERDRKMPVTGVISERLTRELAALTGRPFDAQ
jgi:peptidoglycan hydrolase-like protein with peptidoglycan-binding domain